MSVKIGVFPSLLDPDTAAFGIQQLELDLDCSSLSEDTSGYFCSQMVRDTYAPVHVTAQHVLNTLFCTGCKSALLTTCSTYGATQASSKFLMLCNVL
jgi:hypothetical protein